MTKRWYVVQTKPNHESLALSQLRNQKFSVFFPVYTVKTKHNRTGVVTVKQLPLFPSYMFVQFDVDRNKRWQTINGTRGVLGLIGCTDEYLTPVPEGCVEDIIARADKRGVVVLKDCVETITEFTPGMSLGIRGENYKGLVATYCSNTEKRVSVLLTLLNRKMRVILPIDAVFPSKT